MITATDIEQTRESIITGDFTQSKINPMDSCHRCYGRGHKGFFDIATTYGEKIPADVRKSPKKDRIVLCNCIINQIHRTNAKKSEGDAAI